MSHPQVTFKDTTFTGKTLLSARRATVSSKTLQTQLDQLKSTGRYDCFKLKWHPIYDDKSMWPVPFHLFWDSDVAKWIEGACYFLSENYDAGLDAAVQELVEMIRGAQQEDGYLNVHYTVVEPTKRWSNLRDMHELYNAGHLIEAAVAHYLYYKNEQLKAPVEKYISLIRKRFGTADGQVRGYPGHPEIELALLRYATVTGSSEAYELAHYFLTERGNPEGQDGKHYYDWETEQRGESRWMRPDAFPTNRTYWNCQAHLPITEQTTVEGHSVRAMYLLTAVADLVCLSDSGDKPLGEEARKSWTNALDQLWNNMVDKRMYVTGGIGAIKQWEGFGIDYFLPQGTDEGGCYAETCASIAVMMLAERMLHVDLDGHYGDILELCLYNNVMTSMSTDGTKFTYVNQLASSDKDKSERSDWFWCACCPPNLTRLYGSIGGYLWDYGPGDGGAYVNVHLYSSAQVSFAVGDENSVNLHQESNWPWEGKIRFRLSSTKPVDTTLRLRVPAWAQGSYEISPEAPEPTSLKIEKGYLILPPVYTSKNPEFSLEIKNFAPRYLSPHPYSMQHVLALARGPIVYCVEDIDNDWETNHFKDITITTDSRITEERKEDTETGESYIALHSNGWTRSVPNCGGGARSSVDRDLTFVPYYFRSNRGGRGQMRVGLVNGGSVIGTVFPERGYTG
ncbi:unnamed protein product [Clonostachys chloroleuca]|uniref:Non-reducing end beta-L-arabinofuranosidase n=1 Tax=Clonostachys chloroleuca TaxID=1926264 RepID=A0AA35MBW6_9HYPO|nr:unnamed protein product [Clonostachys chloroleuca]